MRTTPSLDTIYNELYESLALYPEGSAGGAQPENAFGAGSLDDRLPSDHTSRLIGIVFSRPDSKYADEIIKGLPYYHYRSGSSVDFFFAGYGSDSASDGDPDLKSVIKFDNDDEWFFSPKAFDSLRKEMEESTKWIYGGGTDILFFAALGNRQTVRLDLDFSSAIVCNLEQMEKDGAITSVGMFLEPIIKFADKYEGDDPLWQLSDKLGLKQAKGFALDALLAFLPETVRKLFKSAKHLAVRDISK